MRITRAAQLLGTSPRMLRYRDLLGLLPPVRQPSSSARPGGPLPAPGLPERGLPERGLAAGGRASSASRPIVSHPTAGLAAAASRPTASHPASGLAGAASSAPAGGAHGHRHFSDDDLAAIKLGLWIERRYDVSPAALAFGLRVLTEPSVRAEMTELGRRIGKIAPPPARALEFEKERALRLLNLARSRDTGGPGKAQPGKAQPGKAQPWDGPGPGMAQVPGRPRPREGPGPGKAQLPGTFSGLAHEFAGQVQAVGSLR